MSDHSELKKLAEATEGWRNGHCEWPKTPGGNTMRDFQRAADPETVLELIAELEQAQLIGRITCNFDGYKAVLDERDQLKDEVERLTTDNSSLRGSCAKLGVEHAGMVRIHRKANTEIRRLHAEVEAMRKDAERYRWLMSDAVNNGTLGIDGGWIDFGFKDEAAEIIDAAMTKGDHP